MKERSFIDTNVLVYTDDADAPDKCARAVAIVEQGMHTGQGFVSTQVLQEYFVAATRKLDVETEIAKQKTRFFSRLHTIQVTSDDILSAIQIHQLHAIAFWDALIVHSAHQAGCSVLLSEDMSHGQVIEGVRIHNPFLQTA